MDDLQKQVRNVKFAAFDDLVEKIVSDANYSAAAALVAVVVILLTFGTSHVFARSDACSLHHILMQCCSASVALLRHEETGFC